MSRELLGICLLGCLIFWTFRTMSLCRPCLVLNDNHPMLQLEKLQKLQSTATVPKSTRNEISQIQPSVSDNSRDYSGNVAAKAHAEFVVPNVVHFIWFDEKPRVNRTRMNFLNYISVTSAYKVQKPSAILFHCNVIPVGVWWDRIRQEVPILKIIHRHPPILIHGQKLSHVYHRADVAKLEVLLEYGGIYLDYDVIVVNSLDPLRHFDATLGKEKKPALIAGIIISQKNSTFLRLVHEAYRGDYQPTDWDYNCAFVPYRLYLNHSDLVNVERYKLTTPDYSEIIKLYRQVIDWSKLYVIHVMGHHLNWYSWNPDSVKTMRNTIGEVIRYIYYGNKAVVL